MTCSRGGYSRTSLKQEILALEIVAAAQNALDDLRYRQVLIEAVLPTALEQRHARLKHHFVTGFVAGGAEAL
jgi:hypothetical protein